MYDLKLMINWVTHLPILALVDSVSVGLRELGLLIESSDGRGELGHGVKV